MDVDRSQYYDDGGGGSRRNRNRGGKNDRHHPRRTRVTEAAIDAEGLDGGGRGDRRGDRRGRGPRDDGALSFRFLVKVPARRYDAGGGGTTVQEYQKETPRRLRATLSTIVMMKVRSSSVAETLKRRDVSSLALEFFDARANGSLVIYTEDGGADDGTTPTATPR